jgi:hypothetical protein
VPTSEGDIDIELGSAIMTVKLWRRRYIEAGVAVLANVPCSGFLSTYARKDRDRPAALTMAPPPDGTSHWSVRRMASRAGKSPSIAQRILTELGYKSHQSPSIAPRHRPYDELGRDVVRRQQPPVHPPGQFQEREGTRGHDRLLDPHLKRWLESLHLVQDRGRDHCQGGLNATSDY